MAKALSRRLAGRPEAEQAADIVHEINEAVAETRALSRQLFPAAADAEGLPPALRDLAATTARKAGVECTCDWEDDLPLPEVPPDEGTPAPMHLYRIAQEAVSNAIRHGQAKRIRIIGRREGPHGVMEVLDDGVGFAATAGAPTLGLGLRTMGYRAARLGAELKTGEEYAGSTVVRLRWRLEPGNPPFSLGK
jgi:signal transduction histidine kinase